MPKVSVIIPTYNRAKLLKRAIQSVLNQTYQDYEIIIVDDGSTDNTQDLVNNINDRRLRYIRHDVNRGEAAARNTGIKAAKGEYVAFQDSDDESSPERFEKQIKVFQKESLKLMVVYTSMYRINSDGVRTRFRTPRIMPQDGIIYRKALDYHMIGVGIGTSLVRRICFEEVGLFDEHLPYYVDLEFFIRVAKHFYFYHIDEPLLNYYEAPGSLGADPRASIETRKVILEKYFADIKKSRKILARHYFGIGRLLCAREDARQGRNYIVKAILAYPLNAKYILAALLSLLGQRSYSIVTDISIRIHRWSSKNV